MLNRLALLSSLLLLPIIVFCQNPSIKELRISFFTSPIDSIRYQSGIKLYDHFEELNRDTAYYYAMQGVQLSSKNNKKLNEAHSLNRLAYQELNLGNYASALDHLLEAFSIAENKSYDQSFWDAGPIRSLPNKRLYVLSTTHHIFALLMRQTGDNEQELKHLTIAKRIADDIKNPARSLLGCLNLGRVYMNMNKLDSAWAFESEGENIARRSGLYRYLSGILFYKGSILLRRKDTTSALPLFYEGTRLGEEQNNYDGMVLNYEALQNYHMQKGDMDSSLYYAKQKMQTISEMGSISNIVYHIGTAYESMFNVFRSRNQRDSAYKYLNLAYLATDSINKARIKSLAEFQQLTLGEQQRLQNAEKEKINYRNKLRTKILLAGIAVLLILALLIYRNARLKQKSRVRIQQAYDHLKATQQQLIQSEKMASLGELTAGIAHEIQNPLNFVNNFSEVNSELVDELIEQSSTGNLQSAIEIAKNIKENEAKIHYHGKRADAIVKSMLSHSSAGSGKKEKININALADEYMRLAYHGLRARDNSFQVKIETAFDPGLPTIEMVPHDLGRVLLNLINNALYAVDEKRKKGIQNYEPTISIRTEQQNSTARIILADNGGGIPDNIKDKIFQPFFTTKPTGQGTGLGLSLSYDIIKAYNGEITVNTNDGEGSEFLITLPFQ